MSADTSRREASRSPTGSDDELVNAARREVEQIRAPGGSPAGATLESPGGQEPAFAGPPPDSFVGYTIVREIHRGGQGVVYQAIQESTKRKVAIKVMKEGPFAGPADRARFDREVHVLGQLNHPNIVAIHDTGSAAGSFYFVMDYISGQPLDVYMASGERSIDKTLKLFGKICQAVNAAHLRGIIHRDLKPGNIRIDAEGEPHVLDFGLAKVATSEAEASMMTMTGQFIGSLPWASPEQAEGAPGKIDVRTDVYSLGVILYQMLTGKFPYDVIGNMRDVLDRIMTAEPTRPSTIRKQINDEVETIVLKCLSKERDRRYQTAGELGRDVGHYLAGDPIEAKRDSFGYMMRKQLRRYRVPVAVAAGFVLLLAVGVVVIFGLYVEAERSRRSELQQRKVAEVEREQAIIAREDTAAVNEFYRQMLGAADPFATADSPPIAKPMSAVTVRELLEEAASRAGPHFAGKPELEAEVRATLAVSFRCLEDHDAAESQAREVVAIRRDALGEEHPETVKALSLLANTLSHGGKRAEAIKLARAVYDIRRRGLGPEHVDTLCSALNLAYYLMTDASYDEAESLLRTVWANRHRFHGDQRDTPIGAMADLSFVLLAQGRPKEAEAAAREAVQLAERTVDADHIFALWAKMQLAQVLHAKGQHEEAAARQREVLRGYRRLLGDDHQYVQWVRSSLTSMLMAAEDVDDAEALLREQWETHCRDFGRHDPRAISSAASLARVLNAQGDFEEAEQLAREIVEVRRRTEGEGSLGILTARAALSEALQGLGQIDEAETIARQTLEAAQHKFPGGFAGIPYFRARHGRCLTGLKRYAEAEQQLLTAHQEAKAMWAEGDKDHVMVLEGLVHLYEAWGKPQQAAEWRAQLPTTQPSPAGDPLSDSIDPGRGP